MGAKLISELSLNGNEHVLDLGCGDGTNTAMIAELLPNGQVAGIDASEGMIKAAKPKERNNLQFFIMDIDAIKFINEFDVIYSNATLMKNGLANLMGAFVYSQQSIAF
ncbi:MAG TPA: class I SAM-dependent methyltransferase [Desulfobacteria bacterium]|nr:class I SAM-dependent methyltransferase [Desulfobacteria bacterium]